MQEQGTPHDWSNSSPSLGSESLYSSYIIAKFSASHPHFASFFLVICWKHTLFLLAPVRILSIKENTHFISP
jgi:hypothetical protein